MRYSRAGYWGSAAAAVAIVVFGIVLILKVLGPGNLWLKAVIYSATSILGAGTAILAFRYADEVMIETQKSHWFWGSLGAVIATMPLMIFIGWSLIPLGLPARLASHPQAVFVLGMAAMFVAQGLGFMALGIYRRLFA